MPQQILNAVVHKIEKTTSASAMLLLAPAVLDREDQALLSLIEQVQRIYSERSSKQYGEFDASGQTPGIKEHIQQLYANGGAKIGVRPSWRYVKHSGCSLGDEFFASEMPWLSQ